MFKPRITADGIATGQSPTSIAAAVMTKPCAMCSAQGVLRSLSSAPEKSARVKKALFKAGLKPHTCPPERRAAKAAAKAATGWTGSKPFDYHDESRGVLCGVYLTYKEAQELLSNIVAALNAEEATA